MEKVSLFDFEFIAAQNVELVAEDVIATKEVETGKWPLIVTPNVDQIVKLSLDENEKLRLALRRASWVLPDGQPIVSLSKIIYKQHGLPARLTGSDFFPVVWDKIKKLNAKTMFVLPSQQLGELFLSENKNSCYYSPPFFEITDRAVFLDIMTQIVKVYEANRPEFIFIGLGFPKQEWIAIELYTRIEEQRMGAMPKTFLLGAAFEFYFGLKKRAPVIWQKLGIEFVHRLLSEPRRMFKRYLIDDLKFLPMAIDEYRNKKRQESRSNK